MKVCIALLLGAAIFAGACGRNSNATQQNTNQTQTTDVLGAFNADSAYSYIDHQVAFGPRVPGSEAHRQCRDWLIASLKRFGADTVYVQDAQIKAYNGDKLPITNIIACYNSGASKRVLLAAHWDSRPWADKAFNANDSTKPVPGANDGGSGVGVILELIRNLAQNRPKVGVDFILFDAEDYGESGTFDSNSESWCLGSQYWAKNIEPYTAENLPEYGIVLDMVGGKDAVFHYEAYSSQMAPNPTMKIWSEAERLGHGHIFERSVGGVIIDDHIPMNRAGIPTTDIIELNNHQTGAFPPTWHTLEDKLENIDKNTLKAVGETVLNVIYKEKSY